MTPGKCPGFAMPLSGHAASRMQRTIEQIIRSPFLTWQVSYSETRLPTNDDIRRNRPVAFCGVAAVRWLC